MTMNLDQAFFFFERGQSSYALKVKHEVELDVEDLLYKAYKTHKETHGNEIPREILRALEAGWKSMEESKL